MHIQVWPVSEFSLLLLLGYQQVMASRFLWRFPPISARCDSEFSPLPSPRTYLGSTHSPCQLWKLRRCPQPGWGSNPLLAGPGNGATTTDGPTARISTPPARQISTSRLQSTGLPWDSVLSSALRNTEPATSFTIRQGRQLAVPPLLRDRESSDSTSDSCGGTGPCGRRPHCAALPEGSHAESTPRTGYLH